MNYELTNDADYLICALYKYYKEQRKSGKNKSDAKFIGSSEFIFTKLLSELVAHIAELKSLIF